jgi:copper transport protein
MIMRRFIGVRWGRLAAVAIALVVLAAVLRYDETRIVRAHAALISSSPENGSQERRPPLRVTLNFSEPVEPKLTNIDVFDVDGNEVDENDVIVNKENAREASVGVPTLEPGVYTVEFSNLSTVDGHPWQGVIQFIVLNADGTVPPNAEFDPDAGSGVTNTGLLPKNTDSALKWIALLALAITLGAALFVALVAKPAAAFLEDEDFRAAVDAAQSWVVTLAHILLPASFIAASLLIVISVGRFETPVSLFEYLTTVRTGRYQLAGLALVAVALIGADLLYLGRQERLRKAGLVLLIAGCTAAMVTYSMISHGATGEGKFWSVLSDFIHFGASAVWLGALVLLIPLLRFARRYFSDEPLRFLYLANALDRFSVIAGLSVAIVLVSGVFNALVEIPAWDAFTDTTYGKVLLAKLIIVGLLLPFAGLNAFILKPRLVAAIDGLYQQGGAGSDDQRRRWSSQLATLQRMLPITIAVELVVVVAVFASVAVLTQTSTAKGEIAQKEAAAAASTEFTDVKDAAELQIGIEIQPNRVGINRYTLIVRNAAGSPATNVTQARLRFSYTDPTQPDVRPAVAELILRPSTTPGEFEGQGAYFTQPGSWLVEAGLRRSGADDVARAFSVPVSPSQTSSSDDDGGAFALPFETLGWNEVVGVLLALAGMLVLIYREQIQSKGTRHYRVNVTAATAMILAGAVLWFGVDSHQTSGDPSAGNPVDATDESVAAGKMLFQQNCVVCHGPEGRGDGPQAASLDPSPTDFRLHLPLHTDPQFFAFIANGYPGSAMPAWRDDFSDEEIWNIVNYLRTFSDVPIE